jgi:proteasome lid subunit RPN8/RPN11
MPPERRLLIAETLLAELRAAARAALPEECCGLLLGRRDPVATVTRLVPARNVHAEPTRKFTLDPAAQFAVLKAERGGAADRLIGHYHSHPKGPAAPSPRDLAAADDPDLLWLVIDAAGGEIGAFQPLAGTNGAVEGFAALALIATPSQIP